MVGSSEWFHRFSFLLAKVKLKIHLECIFRRMFPGGKENILRASSIEKKGASMTDESGKQRLQERNRPDWYEVQVEGQINPSWFSWLDNWEITHLSDGNTLLVGLVIDQPALHGLFARFRDLNIKIVSLKKCSHSASPETQDT
jgi:hypothetical protein